MRTIKTPAQCAGANVNMMSKIKQRKQDIYLKWFSCFSSLQLLHFNLIDTRRAADFITNNQQRLAIRTLLGTYKLHPFWP